MIKHFLVLLLLGGSLFAAEPDAVQPPDTLYAWRCRQVLQQMDGTEVMLVASAGVKNRCGDVDYPYRQDSNMLYLSGWQHPFALLMLSPRGVHVGGKVMHTVCFYHSKAFASSVYHRPPRMAAGCDTLLAMDRLDALLTQVLSGIRTLYYSLPNPVFIQEPVTGKHFFLDREMRKVLRSRYPGLTIKPAAEPLNRLRQIKSDAEIRLLQQAADITAAGLREAIKSAEPGMYEYELQAVIEYTYQRLGAASPGFPSIVGSGPNALILHYDDNDRRMQAGDMVVMDVGAEYNGYSADITRTIPVSGVFTEGQRELYEAVLTIQKETLAVMKPGVSRRRVEEKAREVCSRELMRLGLIKKAEEAKRFLPHGVSHDIGLEVHDVGSREVLEAGMVVTLEPGLYIPADDPAIPEKYRSVGIRIEDDVWIVEGGNRVITSGLIKEVKDIEKLMKQKGLANQRLSL